MKVKTFGLPVLAKMVLLLTLPQIQTLIFLKLAVGGHLTLFVTRSKPPLP